MMSPTRYAAARLAFWLVLIAGLSAGLYLGHVALTTLGGLTGSSVMEGQP